jgi:hypothetical protein
MWEGSGGKVREWERGRWLSGGDNRKRERSAQRRVGLKA